MQTLWFGSKGFNKRKYSDDQYRERFEKFDKLLVENFSFLQKKDSANRRPSKLRELADNVRAVSVAAGLILQFLRGGDFLEVAELYFDLVFPEGRRMMRTKKGHLGLVPAEALPGDKVVLIAGSSVPFILRPAGGSRYRLVGDSYIYSIMDGKAWDKTQTVTIWLE